MHSATDTWVPAMEASSVTAELQTQHSRVFMMISGEFNHMTFGPHWHTSTVCGVSYQGH